MLFSNVFVFDLYLVRYKLVPCVDGSVDGSVDGGVVLVAEFNVPVLASSLFASLL